MTNEEAKRIIEIEKSCVMRNEGRQCDRDCGKCDLVLDTFSIIEAYNFVLKTIEFKTKYRKMAKRFKRKYVELKKILDNHTMGKTPCDLCRYNLPSSFGEKPCSMCPAEGRINDDSE